MSQTLSPRPHVRAVVEDGGAVLLDLAAGKYFSLNELGSHVWRHLEAGLDRRALLDELAGVYPDVPRDALERDVDTFLHTLRRRELVDVRH